MSSVRIRLGTLPKVLEILEFQGLFFFWLSSFVPRRGKRASRKAEERNGRQGHSRTPASRGHSPRPTSSRETRSRNTPFSPSSLPPFQEAGPRQLQTPPVLMRAPQSAVRYRSLCRQPWSPSGAGAPSPDAGLKERYQVSGHQPSAAHQPGKEHCRQQERLHSGLPELREIGLCPEGCHGHGKQEGIEPVYPLHDP